jgi:hypothetical protein
MMEQLSMRRQLQTFEIVLLPPAEEKPVPLRSTNDPNKATMVFHAELQRLRQEHAQGELVVLQAGDEGNTLLRQPLTY